MAQDQYNQIYTLSVQPGIKRDGTVFEAREFSDGVWCRFQRGVPKKMGGYSQIAASFSGISRGMIMNSYNGLNYIFSGTNNNLDIFTTDQNIAVGNGPYSAIFNVGYAPIAITANTTGSFTVTGGSTTTGRTGMYPAGTKVVFTKSANPTVYTVTSSTFATPNTTVNFTPALSGTVTTAYLADVKFNPDPRLLWQFDYQYEPLGGALNLIAHPGLNLNNVDNGVESPVFFGSTTSNVSNSWTFNVLADSDGTAPTYKPIQVDGGVCVLPPFIFVYGSNGFIANNHVSSIYPEQSFTNWNGPTANQTNVATGKIVKGMTVRGGTNSPSGLFWATDSLVRVSFVNNPPQYWQYDVVSSQISIMSSSAVVEMDGVYYWMGVDRFYAYNGVVQVLANDKNVNWLFNNLNYFQRQKVWATKVPRYNEIWFFYPRGTSLECTDAIVYNVKDKLWYDAGQAEGAQRSSGFTTEVFPTPIWSDWNYKSTYSVPYTVLATPPGQSAATIYQVYIKGDVTTVFSPGQYISKSLTSTEVFQIVDSQYITTTAIGNPGVTKITTLTSMANPVVFPATPVPLPAGTLIYNVKGGYALWQHEIGVNKVSANYETAVYSAFKTCDISWVGGTPSEDTSVGINRRMHLRRIEPDFVQSGPMDLTVSGRKFARGNEENSGPYTFTPDTEKIDLRVEHREVSLLFESNTIDGDYEMGRILITAELGDERP